MKERRRAQRHRCRLRVEIRRGAERLEASLLDVSLSGLSLQAGAAFAQGDPVELAIEGQVCVKALAWHTHRLKRPGAPTYVIGMMLAEVGPEYERLVSRVAASRPAARPCAPGAAASGTQGASEASSASPAAAPAASASNGPLPRALPATPPAPAAAAAATSAPPRRGAPPIPTKRPPWWRLRIKETAGTRSRVVTLAAASKEAAVAGSLAEAGDGWEVLEVVLAS